MRFRILIGKQQPLPEFSPSIALGRMEVAVEAIFAGVLELLTASLKRVVGNEPYIKVSAA